MEDRPPSRQDRAAGLPGWPEEAALGAWRSGLARFLAWADVAVGRTKRWIRSAFDLHEPAGIVPYRGFGTRERFLVKGRVLEGLREVAKEPEDPSRWQAFKRAVLRYHTTEVPGARVCVRFGDHTSKTESDADGYFDLTMAVDVRGGAANGDLWHDVELELERPLRPGQAAVLQRGHVVVPPPRARFLVVSDVDDTIVVTGANTIVRYWRTQLLGTARSRVPLPGMAAFYRRLHAGSDGRPTNPIFYLSSSPWNLYDLLEGFLDYHGFPLGPLLLLDYGFGRDKLLRRSHRAHKLDHLRVLLDTYPRLPLLLVGDSGQKDAEIYRDVVRACPDRVLAIYIRDVARGRRDRLMHAVADDVARYGVDLVLSADTQVFVEHAARRGWIRGERT